MHFVLNLPKTSRKWLQAVLNVNAKAAGISPDEMLLETGLDPEKWHAGDWVDQTEVTELWRAGERLSGRPELALDMLNEMQVTDTGLLALEFMSSTRLRDAINDLLRHSALLTQAWIYELNESGKYPAVIIRPSAGFSDYSHHSLDVNVASGVFWARTLLGRSEHDIHSVTFSHDGHGLADRYTSILGCPCLFSQTQTSVRFTPGALDYEIATGDEQLHSVLQARIGKHLREGKRWSDIVKFTLSDLLDQKIRPSRQQVAELIGVSERSLVRHLETEKTSFRLMVEQVVEEKALSMLKTGVSAEKIAEHMGYSDSSTLARMLKRRTGQKISELRNR